jgi:DNA replication and repair protein RecF
MSDLIRAQVCRSLRLRQFRNFPELDLEFPDTGIAVIGDNGSGKTNLLESIYYLEIFRSFRSAPDEQLVRFGAEAFHIRAVFAEPGSDRELEITAAYEPRTRTKRVTVDGSEPERLGEAIGRVRVVVFSPSDMALVAGAPSERRRFLDIVLSVNVAGYLETLQRYRQVLRQRNAMLRARAAPALIEVWDPGFIDAGARVMYERARWLSEYAEAFERRYRAVGDGRRAIIEYRPGLRGQAEMLQDLEQVRQAMCGEAMRVAPRERERGMTLFGPHRDDIAILADSDDGAVELREFGSGGQMRTAAIALRLTEAVSARRARQASPMILLDDVFAELDPGRSRRLLDMLEAEGHGQVILTAPKASDVDRDGVGRSFDALPRWAIHNGRISKGS